MTRRVPREGRNGCRAPAVPAVLRQAARAAALAVVLVAAGLGFGVAPPAKAGTPRFVTVGTASPAGAYYPLGVAMADLWNRSIPGVQFMARETGGGVANMNLLASGQIEVGIANENIAYDAIKGNAPFNRPIAVAGGWVLNQSMGVFVALQGRGLRSVEDLRGKRVSLGSPGSASNVLGVLVLESQGVPRNAIQPVYLGWQESADALKDGLIDAAFMVGGQPFPAIQSLAARARVTLLSFDGARFRASSTYPYVTGKIPRAMYNLDQDGDAVVVRSIVYLRPDLPEELVYRMVQVVFANIPTLRAAHPSGDEAALLSQADAREISLTVHPGVVRYAVEQGKW